MHNKVCFLRYALQLYHEASEMTIVSSASFSLKVTPCYENEMSKPSLILPRSQGDLKVRWISDIQPTRVV